jgi:hypothetical protein
MNELSMNEYRSIASEWHGGQASPLYAFASSGQIPDAWEGLREIDQCLKGLHRGNYSPEEIATEEPRLLALRELFEFEKMMQGDDEEYDGPEREAAKQSLLMRIAEIADALDDRGLEREAADMHAVFVRIAKAKSKKNVPTNPKLWAECQDWARSKYDVHPSAYSNAAAAKRYKEKGGKWKKED